ncbi:MAG: LysR family transcriptional regulator [Stappia sp.]|uniref:LysR family transcriptional regulator n=1 Tax=Stappia sp. TaxID=1870903 RepID=UPI000C54CFFF|nr:LysR family transcriptional regulator [Stappia sp.]MAB00231.1 LysR family transcriptional regulator [Stappia sp.]MBM21044.1 LysR family transcriptional regulator [Stappia sp.]
MDRITELEALVALAETGSFSAAARQLNRSPATMTRLIASLEARLDLSLVARSTRRVALTEPGERFVGEARRVLTAMMEAEDAARGASGRIAGNFTLTAPVLFGEMFVAPLLRDYLERWPDVRAKLVLTDRVVDMLEEGVDLALRIGTLSQAGLTARKVGNVRAVLVASPDYLARFGLPETPADLSRHRIVATETGGDLPGATGPLSWSFENESDRETALLMPRLTVSSIRSAIDAARAGFGIARALSYQVADPLISGGLVELLASFETRRQPVSLVHRYGQRAPARVRTFIDFTTAALARQRHRLDGNVHADSQKHE